MSAIWPARSQAAAVPDPAAPPPASLLAPSGAGKSLLIEVASLTPDRAVARLIDYAVFLGASDLFLLCTEEGMVVQVRHLGVVRTISHLQADFGRRCVSYAKASASMDISERRRPLDGRWLYQPESGQPVDLRINMIPTMYGEDLALRMLVRGAELQNLDSLGLTVEQQGDVEGMLSSPAGLILVTGPTGSGKTMTLYGCLRQLNNGERKINTIEDPIEYAVAGLRQSQVQTAFEVGFYELLRSVLRQSPDVIMIGEIRDAETAETTVRAANSGHLVFATIHAATAAGAIQSIRALGVHPHFLSTALRGVIAQRLVRTLCPHCKVGFDLQEAPETFSEVRAWLRPEEGQVLYAPRGCESCGHVGYAGRSGVFEVMNVHRSIRNLISEGRPTREIHDKAIEERMLNFRQSALLKVARGLTSTEEIIRVIPTEHLLVDD